jgi:serine/threonine protein kinase
VGIRVIAPLWPDDPQVIGPYRLYGELGRGGMGRVFVGLSADGQPVAVKVIRAELAADREFRARFGQEVAAARKVSGRYTAHVVDADLDGPVPWLATTYVAGPSLAEAVKDHGQMPVDIVLWLAARLAEGLIAIHAAGVVHRDLNPSNILLAEDGPRVIDFGISQAAWESSIPGADFGSPGFMSPEHALGQVVGPPGDVFSLGAVLTFAATGQGPFGPGSSAARIYRLVNSPPVLDTVPAELRGLVGSCLAKHPGDRPTASSVRTQVDAIRRQFGWLSEPASGMFTSGLQASGASGSDQGAKIPALVGVSSGAGPSDAEPRPGSANRHQQRRFSRSLRLFVPGLVAAAATALYLVSRATVPSPAILDQPQPAVTTPAVQNQPQAIGPAPAATSTKRGSSSAQRDLNGPSVIQGPSVSTLPSPAAFTSVVPTLPPSEAAATSHSLSPAMSPSGSKSPSPSPSGSKSPSPSPSGSKSPSPSPSSSSPSPSPSSSSPPPSPSPSSSSPSPSPSSSSPSAPPSSSCPSAPATSATSARA